MADQETKIDLINLNSKKEQKGVTVAGQEKGTSPAGGIEETGKKKWKKVIWIAGALGIVLISGAVLVVGYLGYIPIPGISVADSPASVSSGKTEMGEMVKLSPLIINLNEENGRHYLKTTIVLEVVDKKWVERIQQRMSVFTDMVILIVSDKKLEDMRTSGFKERLREELLTRFNGHFGEKGVAQIYFDEFLFQ